MFRMIEHYREEYDDEPPFDPALFAVKFKGFDGNDSLELKMMLYGRGLVLEEGLWDEFRPVFERDGGNSHHPMLGKYKESLALLALPA